MRLIVFIFIITIFTSQSFSQQTIQGVIIDSVSNEPLPYAHVFNTNSLIGTITNEDGMFKLKCLKNDTLRISYIGYSKKFIPSTYFIEKIKYGLQPSNSELKTFEVFSDVDFILDLLIEAKKKMWQGKTSSSKTYFTLNSIVDDEPIESLECYYNGEVKPSGFGDLKLKNGRIGLVQIYDNYFVSLSTTEVISDYDLLTKDENELPKNPLHLSKSSIKRIYNYDIIDLKDGVYKVEFRPKKHNENFFTAQIHLDSKKKQLVGIDLSASNIKTPPFRELNKTDTMRNFNYNISYLFDNSKNNLLEKVEFNYDFEYWNKLGLREVSSEGLFLFYDKATLFDTPYYSESANLVNDYDRIVAQPYNGLFWYKNEILLPSKKSLELRSFFEKNGVLLNFNNLNKYHSVFQNKVIPWSEERIFPHQLNKINSKSVSKQEGVKTASRQYNLSTQIYLDRNVFEDSTYYIAETLIDVDKSYSYLKRENVSCFINLYFDQVEITKNKMLSTLNSKKWSKQQVDSIFNNTKSFLSKKLKSYTALVNHGRNEKMMNFYINDVKKDIGIDNSTLLLDSELESSIKDVFKEDKSAHIEMYQYAKSLEKLKEYKKALSVLLRTLELGDSSSWLYYNIGLMYQELDDDESACLLYEKSIALGKTIDPEILKICEK